MSLLSIAQIRTWLNVSLQSSGLRELAEKPLGIWRHAVRHGHPAFPPGLLGLIYERLTGQTAGPKTQGVLFRPEAEFLAAIWERSGLEHLEGVFVLQGADSDDNFTTGVIYQLLERLPAFSHPQLQIVSRDLEEALQGKSEPALDFPAREYLEDLYRSAAGSLKHHPLQLSPTDLFEITHPHLFPRPADRTFYRGLMAAMTGISLWTTATFTLHEDSAMVVSKFGEPQMLRLGGYDSLTNRGNISSLVPSELAYIDEELEVDLFDYKYCENQLLFFQREEGAVFRIRRRVIVPVRITPFLEHERNLGLFFGWIMVLAEKVLEVFSKDIVEVYFELSGYRPSALEEAIGFLRHFLTERKINEQIRVFVTPEKAPRPGLPQQNGLGLGSVGSVEVGSAETPTGPALAQWWVLGGTPEGDLKHLSLEFPQTEEFAAATRALQERLLGEEITRTIESMVEYAHR